MIKSVLIFFGFIVISYTSMAQQEIKLYKNGPAESSGITEKEERNAYSFVTNVTDARMYAYLAPAEKSNGTAVLICPGGGYGGLAVEHEGSMVAQWLNSLGISAFVLYYRMPATHWEIPLNDAQTALQIIKKKAKEWHIDKHKIGIMGFSAGGHLASTAGTHYTHKTRPDFMVLVYPVIYMSQDGTTLNLLGENPPEDLKRRFSNDLHVTADTPPTLLIVAKDDDVVPADHSFRFYKALQDNKVRSELHTYQTGGHGFGMWKRNAETDGWTDVLQKWLSSNGLL
ncbi:MAG TPA: alpha/beta hydrolase [Bacteroidales bacterium]|nr:alpha/beta hydrolase [Bacteroidales bacterium]